MTHRTDVAALALVFASSFHENGVFGNFVLFEGQD